MAHFQKKIKKSRFLTLKIAYYMCLKAKFMPMLQSLGYVKASSLEKFGGIVRSAPPGYPLQVRPMLKPYPLRAFRYYPLPGCNLY